jgi:hypothetical protein
MKTLLFYFGLCLLCAKTSLLSSSEWIAPPNGKTYALEMIDPVVHSARDYEGIRSFFTENGYVVVDNVSKKIHRDALVVLIDEIIQENIPFSRRLGFLDLYHDQTLAELRQNPDCYKVFSHLFGNNKLWVVFDRVIYQAPNENEEALNPHVDQNPLTHPGFFNLQAMIALRDMNEFTGTLAVVPKSPVFFHTYGQWADPKDGYIEYQDNDLPSFVGLRLKEGQIVIWDSRTTHSRFRKEGVSKRYAALVTYTLAKNDPELVTRRLKYFYEGIGWNDHDAGLRATARPRCLQSLRKTPEQLSPLGRKLYGLDSWF